MTMLHGGAVVESCRYPGNQLSKRYIELFRQVYGVELAEANLEDRIIAAAFYDLVGIPMNPLD